MVVAWYRDGGKEFLDVDTWSRLMGHRSWTSQLIALQGYVHASSNSMGIYTTSDQIDATRREQKGNPALDTFTKGLAQYCEGAYARAAEANENNRRAYATSPPLMSQELELYV